ncbi:MAG: TIGR02757 family protein, partial [Spirochaetales bacterium]|nr:TIGR02757 family protein [Spirochaetales bacterium]
MQDIKARLDSAAARTNTPEFIASDPVQFPRRYSRVADAELACFLAALIAWGRRDIILRSARRMFGAMGESPYDYIMSGGWKKLGSACVHRTFFETDLAYVCRGLRACLRKYASLEKLFAGAGDMFNGIALFRKTLARGNSGKYSKHIADPDRNSACKRMNLALRWLVRRDGIVDLGLWKSISPARLYIPLDVHVARTARLLGLLDRKSNDRKAVEILT